ncbi:PAAR domain-containing protein [Bartonella sp. HY038]|uniref:PAAR domain-containing protein n=1 Tax=Bartonella sp. HY038 TaxID=2759660 RepID=UPI0015FC1073|nr:PAAR domain-containing protein [Bartonella sp. HY038]
MAKEVVRVGDLHQCPIHGDNVVISGQAAISDPKPIACIGDSCACGGVITQGTSSLTINGKQVAYTGCTTSCGGIVIGSSTLKV